MAPSWALLRSGCRWDELVAPMVDVDPHALEWYDEGALSVRFSIVQFDARRERRIRRTCTLRQRARRVEEACRRLGRGPKRLRQVRKECGCRRTTGAVSPPRPRVVVRTVTIVAEMTSCLDVCGKVSARAKATAPLKPAKARTTCMRNEIRSCSERPKLMSAESGKTCSRRPTTQPTSVSPMNPQSAACHALGSHADRPRYAKTTVSLSDESVLAKCAVVSLAVSERLYLGEGESESWG